MNLISQLKWRAVWRAEIRRLGRDIASRPPPLASPLAELRYNRATWRVTLPNLPDCFMCAPLGVLDETSFVVHVDADAFYRGWLLSSRAGTRQSHGGCVLRADMPHDRKFADAVRGFAVGAESPVPLAFVGASHVLGRPHVGFINGITRTFWLLSHHAPSFPVRVSGLYAATVLHELAGLQPPQPLAELYATATSYPAAVEPAAR